MTWYLVQQVLAHMLLEERFSYSLFFSQRKESGKYEIFIVKGGRFWRVSIDYSQKVNLYF